MLLPDVSEIWVECATDNRLAAIFAVVNGDSTNDLNVRGQRVEGLVPLDTGTNTVVFIAADAAGNTSSNVFTIARSTSYRAAITSPALGEFATGPSNVVSGYVSAKFNEGQPGETNVTGVLINGELAVLDWENMDADGNVPFTSANPIPLGIPIVGQVLGDGIPTDPPPSIPPAPSQEYEVTAKETGMDSILGGEGGPITLSRTSGTTCWQGGPSRSLSSQRSEISSELGQLQIRAAGESDNPPTCFTETDLDRIPWEPCFTWENQYREPGPENRALSFGTLEDHHGGGFDHATVLTSWDPNTGTCTFEARSTDLAALQRSVETGWIRFRVPRHYEKNVSVTFTFEGVSFRCRDGAMPDLSQVKFRGQTPVDYSNETQTVSYQLAVDGGREYTISQDVFEWPSDAQAHHYAAADHDSRDCPFVRDWQYSASWTEDMHWLGWTNFHNCYLKIFGRRFLCPSETVGLVAVPTSATLQWTIIADDTTGAVINPITGVLTAGPLYGYYVNNTFMPYTTTVGVKDPSTGCSTNYLITMLEPNQRVGPPAGGTSRKWPFNHLTNAEVEELANAGISQTEYAALAGEAEANTAVYFLSQGANASETCEDCIQNAVQHAYWNWRQAKKYGVARAKIFTDAHENWGPNDPNNPNSHGNPCRDKGMDLSNNAAGLELFKNNSKDGKPDLTDPQALRILFEWARRGMLSSNLQP